MSFAKVVEVTSMSPKSFEDAAQAGVERVCKTVKNVKSAWVKDQEVVVEGGKVTGYRVSLKVTFVVED